MSNGSLDNYISGMAFKYEQFFCLSIFMVWS
jgi:hypothetical protein